MGLLDVGLLCTLITSAEQKDNLITANGEIEAVSGAVINNPAASGRGMLFL
jgi:hypothetical protein